MISSFQQQRDQEPPRIGPRLPKTLRMIVSLFRLQLRSQKVIQGLTRSSEIVHKKPWSRNLKFDIRLLNPHHHLLRLLERLNDRWKMHYRKWTPQILTLL